MASGKLRAAIRLLTLLALSAAIPSCAALSSSAASSEAKSALQCSTLDTVYPRPHRYGNIRPAYELYRGCGKYAVLRCTYTTERASCVTVEVLDAKAAEAAEPMSFGR